LTWAMLTDRRLQFLVQGDRPARRALARLIDVTDRVADLALGVQILAGHASLSTTQRYIDAHADAQRRIVELV
jgi:integrase